MKAGRPGVTVGRQRGAFINWSQVSSKLPTGRDPESKAKRKTLFEQFDPNGNGYLSLAEVDKGLRDVLQLDELFYCKPAIMRAFQAAKGANTNSKAALGDDYVTRSEFRLLLVYLRRYFELWVMFDDIDTDDDRRVSYDEFVQGLSKIETWGVKCYYPDQTFKAIDIDGHGMILFNEFADWGIKKQLDLEDDDDDEDEVFEEQTRGQANGNGKQKAAPPRGGPPKRGPPSTAKGTIDWKKISAALPAGKSKLENAKRDELFSLFDPNGNKYISLAEVDKGLRDILHLDEVFDCKPAIMRAFQAAKDVNTNSKARLGKDYVTRSEFRVLLSYLRKYFELFVMFDRIDTGDDRRINAQEFADAVGMLKTWGVNISSPYTEFNNIDKNGGGQILFDEFCHWAIPKALDLEDDDD
jgi:Ca2+-binding EF-hand superfamily protein